MPETILQHIRNMQVQLCNKPGTSKGDLATAGIVSTVVLKDKPECRGSSKLIPNGGLGTYGTLRFTGKEEPNLKWNIYNIYDIIVFMYYEKK